MSVQLRRPNTLEEIMPAFCRVEMVTGRENKVIADYCYIREISLKESNSGRCDFHFTGTVLKENCDYEFKFSVKHLRYDSVHEHLMSLAVQMKKVHIEEACEILHLCTALALRVPQFSAEEIQKIDRLTYVFMCVHHKKKFGL